VKFSFLVLRRREFGDGAPRRPGCAHSLFLASLLFEMGGLVALCDREYLTW
jgi:hypothetical protein